MAFDFGIRSTFSSSMFLRLSTLASLVLLVLSLFGV